LVLKSAQGHEISKINIYQDRYLVATTQSTLLLGDLESCKLSELPWRGSGNEKFDFSNPNICMVFNAGELSIVEYGVNEVIGTCRTENMGPNMISARLNYSEQELRGGQPTKIIAYLLDNLTICIQDLRFNQIQATVNHDSKIDYLELNPGGSKLLFRDKRRQLHLYNIKEQKKQTLLNYCKFVGWVPRSDVVVAQNRNNLCVWYSIEEADKVTMYQIKGDVDTIERTEGKTEVLVDDGANTVSYNLDEALIEFGAALEYKGLDRAVEILEPLELTPETEANWKTVAKMAIEQQHLVVAERCYAALGNISKADYLRKINKLVMQEGIDNFRVQAKLAVLEKQFHKAEAILIQHDEIEEAMAMYQELHRWDESIKIAEKKNHPDVREFKENYFQWLLETNQEAKAAEVKEREADYNTAISLYLKGGLPAKAANVVSSFNVGVPPDQLDKISQQLIASGMLEKAGEFYEKMNVLDRALDCYVKGHAFRKAVDLARRAFQSHVVELEEQWGDWLVSQKQLDLSIEHYVQAGIFTKAIEAALNARKWNRAVQLVANQPPEISRPYYKEIAKHYAEVRQLDLAEKYYVNAGEFVEAFEMYVRANKWDQAYQVISRYLPEGEYTMLYVQEARKFEEEGDYKNAERMYLAANEPDLAINIYRKAKQYDHMIRLVTKYRKDLLKDTHQHLAQQLDGEGNLKSAEHHYIEGGAWQVAVDMYRAHELWEDALRVAKANGDQKELGEVAIKVAENMEGEKGTQFLIKNGLIEAAVDFEAN
jgi:intraflagellar transport protein 172